MRYRWFTILSRAPNIVSNEHYPFEPYFFGRNYSLDTGGGGYCYKSKRCVNLIGNGTKIGKILEPCGRIFPFLPSFHSLTTFPSSAFDEFC